MKKGLMGMNDRMIRHYFVDSNSSQGYADLLSLIHISES